MKNEQCNTTGKGFGTSVETPGTTLSAVDRVQQGTQSPRRCKGREQEQTVFRSAGIAADGFLKHQFLPLYDERFDMPKDRGITEGVLNSLSILTQYQQLDTMCVRDKTYPYNILLIYWNAQQQLRKANKNLELFIIEDDDKTVKLATKQRASRTYSLYYIPVLPLYDLLKSRKNKPGAQLLLSVFSYLYHIARIPYYRDCESYLFYHYEILEEWLNDDEDSSIDEQDLIFNREAHQRAAHGGDFIERIIYHPAQLEQFEERITRMSPADAFEQGCLKVATDTLKLWQDYPDRDIFCHLNRPQCDEDDDDNWTGYDNTIRIGEYIHFIADTESGLYDSIQENINAELNEKMYWQEHTVISLFDKNYKPNADNLDYEHRLFVLLDDLCYLLNQLL
jgi:hypothetical protein